VREGDLLVSWAATLGIYVWKGPEAVLNQHIYKVDSKINKSLHFYIMKAILDDLYRQSHGTGMVHITKRRFEQTPVALPPDLQQDRLVALIESVFSRVDAAVAAIKRVQANLRRYSASVLKAACEGRLVPAEAEVARRDGRDYEPASVVLSRILEERRRKWEQVELASMRANGKEPGDDRWKKKYKEPAPPDTDGLPELPEGWCWVSFGQLLREPLRNGRSAKPTTVGGVRAISLTAVTDGDFGEHNTKMVGVSPADAEDLWLEPGDILIERANTPELVGSSAVYRGPSRCVIYPDLVIRARVVSMVVDRFVEWSLKSERARSYLRGAAQGTSGSMPKISQETIELMPFALPPHSEQCRAAHEIERRMSVVTALVSSAARWLSTTEVLRQAILGAAFRGRLHVG
jgi:type I restriction enzyme S subunit